jgi:erythromycin esterase
MNERQHEWLSDRATGLESWRPEIPLSGKEQVAIDSIVGDATVIGLGEMTHGAKEVLEARERILRFLIEERNALVVVMESCFAATRQLNEHVITGASTPIEALTKLEYWSCVNTETLGFVKWLREHNASRKAHVEPVRVYGCDVQSIDGAKAELSRVLEQFQSSGQLPVEECRQASFLI